METRFAMKRRRIQDYL